MNGPYLTDPLNQINQAWKQGRDLAFNDAEGKALTSTGDDQQQALTQAAQLNPAGSLDMAQKNQQVNGQRLVSMARFLMSAPPEQRDAAYQAMKPTLGQLGMDPSKLPANYDDSVAQTAQSLVQAYTPTNQIPAAIKTAQYYQQNLSPEEQAQARRIHLGLDPRAKNPDYILTKVPDGQGGQIDVFYNKLTKQMELPDYSGLTGGQGQPSASAGPTAGATSSGAGWSTTVQPPDAAHIANSVLDRGGTMDDAAAEVQRSVGPNQATDIHLNPQTGRFENVSLPPGATPTRLDAQGNVVAPAATAPAGSGLGFTPAKPEKSEIDKRTKELADLEANGIKLTPDQRNEYLLTGKAPDAAKPSELSADQERLAQALANYQLPTGQRLIADPRNQAVLSRALELNPGLNAAQYAQNQKLLTDLASNAPTSSGGGIVAANTALRHIQALSDVSDKLPDVSPLLNKPYQAAARLAGHTDLADNLSTWDTEVGLAAAEIQKMIKSGVATEGETSKMMDDLSSAKDLGQRRAALASLAEFMNDKVQAQESRRDAVLGDLSPRTSFLNAKSQDILRNVMSKGGKEVPELEAPYTSLGMAVRPAGNAAPVASSPSSNEPARPTSNEEFQALPSGALFINPKDGQLMRKH